MHICNCFTISERTCLNLDYRCTDRNGIKVSAVVEGALTYCGYIITNLNRSYLVVLHEGLGCNCNNLCAVGKKSVKSLTEGAYCNLAYGAVDCKVSLSEFTVVGDISAENSSEITVGDTADVLGVVSIFTYGMKKGIERFEEANVENTSLTDFDTVQVYLEFFFFFFFFRFSFHIGFCNI